MAYGAVCCLELTIERLSKSSHISIAQNSSPQILQHLYDEVVSLKEALGEFNRKRSTINMKKVKSLEAEIIDVVYKFEDVIDPHLSNQFQYSQPEEEEETDHPPLMLCSVDLQEVKQEVDSFIEMVKQMKGTYIHELHNPSPEEEEEKDDAVPSRIDVGGNQSSMVGLSDLFMRVKDRLNSSQSEATIVSLLGMAGIGKTTLANKLFQDPSIVSRYSRRVFLTIGPKYRLHDILVDIVRQLSPGLKVIVLAETETSLAQLKWVVHKILENLRYLTVLDDVWDKDSCYELMSLFPNNEKGSRLLVTTRLHEVALWAHPSSTFEVPFLDKKQSWELLREKVFGEEESFSYEFERAGKKIAENCEGLPLTIVTVASILSEAEKTLEYWNEVAYDKQNSVYKDAYDQMSNVLYPSYDYLEQHLKACFLYFGAFPQNYWVYGYQLTNWLRAEGFLNSKPMHYFESAMTSEIGTDDYLDELFFKKVILSTRDDQGYYLHSSFWYMCNKEAAETEFFYALNCLADALPEERMQYKRRLCIRNSVLFAVEDACNSIASASTVRSLLCTCSSHKYPVPLRLEHLRVLRILEAVSIRFYEFPMEVLTLVQLRYLSLTYDGNLPTSISKLWNLQHLIVSQHCTVSYVGNGSYLPIEIWGMKELKYLQTAGRDLPHPPNCEGSLLPNLLTLTGVGPQSCNKYVLEKIPNLKELVIVIPRPPDATEPLTCFDHISHLHKLEKLSCYIMNPLFKTNVVASLAPLSEFPSSLTHLTLSGLGYSWEEMSKVSSLPNLEHIKLECYAFRRSKWEVHEFEFQWLESLLIEDTDLEQWTFQNSLCLPSIKSLMIKHCYKLKEIPLTFGTSLLNIEVVDCNPMLVDCANKLKRVWDDKYGDGKRSLRLYVHSSL